MNRTPLLAEIIVIRRCELCDVPLEDTLGERQLEFAGHSPELCRVGTLERIRGLQDALRAKDEQWQLAAEQFARQVYEILAKHGLPTLAEQQRLAEVNARLAPISPAGTEVSSRESHATPPANTAALANGDAPHAA